MKIYLLSVLDQAGQTGVVDVTTIDWGTFQDLVEFSIGKSVAWSAILGQHFLQTIS